MVQQWLALYVICQKSQKGKMIWREGFNIRLSIYSTLVRLSFTMNLPHISYWTQNQSISFTLCWLVIGLFNRLQTKHKQCERDVMQMWAAISLGEHCVTCQKTAAKETFRPFFCCFLLTHLTFPDVIQILRNIFINSKDSIFQHPVCLL